jgi:hypothetical protein
MGMAVNGKNMVIILIDEVIVFQNSKDNALIDQIFIDEYGHLEIRDVTEKYNQIIYVNGWVKEAPIRFID